MKFLTIVSLLCLFSLSSFAADENICFEEGVSCEPIEVKKLKVKKIDDSQIDQAYMVADKVLNDIGRAIAGDFEE